MRIFLLCRGYPSAEQLYNYPFLHRRVLQYRSFGHEVHIFVLRDSHSQWNFDGCAVESGDQAALALALSRFSPDCIAAHALADDMWGALMSTNTRLPVFGWLHGSEMLPHYKTNFPDRADPAHRRQKQIYEARRLFWRGLARNWPLNLRLVFVSRTAAEQAQDGLGVRLPAGCWRVIHNPIDTALFAYQPKAPEQRFRVLSIRPFNNWSYANDLTAAAIVKMSDHPLFPQFFFHIIGDGALFETQLAPLADFCNVRCERRFISQDEISALHKDNGVFLVPTRMDTQGVSRDEAMSSGLVPVTNAVAAVPEFTAPDCAGLASAENANELAQAMLEMAQNPALFLQRSQRATARVRRQSAADIIIPAELALMGGAA